MQAGVSFVIRIINKIVPERVGAIQCQEVVYHDRISVHARDNERCLAAIILFHHTDSSFVQIFEEFWIVTSSSSIMKQVVTLTIYNLQKKRCY